MGADVTRNPSSIPEESTTAVFRRAYSIDEVPEIRIFQFGALSVKIHSCTIPGLGIQHGIGPFARKADLSETVAHEMNGRNVAKGSETKSQWRKANAFNCANDRIRICTSTLATMPSRQRRVRTQRNFGYSGLGSMQSVELVSFFHPLGHSTAESSVVFCAQA